MLNVRQKHPGGNMTNLSRRTMLAGAAAALPLPALAQRAPSVSVVSTPPRSWGRGAPTNIYPDPDVVVLDPSFGAINEGHAVIKRIGTGYEWAEGPAWNGVGRYLMWSDIPNDIQLRWLEDDGHVSVFRNPAGNSNGNTFDYQGRQISFEHGNRRVVRYEYDGTVTVLADKFQGKRFNAPNDGIVHPDGSIWFSDPGYGSLMHYEGNKGPLDLKEAVYRIDGKSGKVEKLKATTEEYEGNVGDVTVLPGGALLYSRNSVAVPTDLWTRDAKGKVARLTDVNRDQMAEIDPVDAKRFSFKGANGDTVWGQIIKPAGTQGKIPVAFLVHGGPQSSFGNSWSTRWNPRLFAQQGYGVVTVDFHGSTGYGQAFTDSINKDWGGKPLEDLKLGLAAAGKQDAQLDIANACALGASYGGYMMNWIAGQWTDGFKCLVQHDGVFDARAMAYETEELWFDEWEHGGPYFKVPEEYEKWNPVNHVDKWKTPMLVITSEKDFRIPYTQGLAAFTALQRRGVPSQLLVFPDENHWVLKGANSVQWHRAVFDWMGKHLKK